MWPHRLDAARRSVAQFDSPEITLRRDARAKLQLTAAPESRATHQYATAPPPPRATSATAR